MSRIAPNGKIARVWAPSIRTNPSTPSRTVPLTRASIVPSGLIISLANIASGESEDGGTSNSKGICMGSTPSSLPSNTSTNATPGSTTPSTSNDPISESILKGTLTPDASHSAERVQSNAGMLISPFALDRVRMFPSNATPGSSDGPSISSRRASDSTGTGKFST
ncbi:MAG: hypothetical protein BWY82_02309 [Verrucomicrobia bacterium ADurb.Bin474]|nr:MAG: hypothetical protein BWY82_02309 [Verrucomicrobia bacterium ADurb.Bin474]